MLAVERSLPLPVALAVFAVVVAVWGFAPAVSRWWQWRQLERRTRRPHAVRRTFPYPLPDRYERRRR